MAEAGIGFVDIVPRATSFASTLTTQVNSALKQVTSSTTGAATLAAKGATAAFVGLGTGAAIAIGKGVKATLDWASQVRSLQRVTGQTAEDASRLAGAGNILGISVQKLNIGFGLLSKNIVNGATNLEKYGIATRNADGSVRPFNDVLAAVSKKFATLPKGPEQAAFAMNVFGRSGKDLIPILSQGADGLAELEQKAEDAGLVMSQDTLDASKELGKSQRELGDAVEGAAISIGTAFVPVLKVLTDILTGFVELIQKIPKPILSVVAALAALKAASLLAGKAIGTELVQNFVTAITASGTLTGALSALTATLAAQALALAPVVLAVAALYTAYAIATQKATIFGLAVTKATDTALQLAQAAKIATDTGIPFAKALEQVQQGAENMTVHINKAGVAVTNFAGLTNSELHQFGQTLRDTFSIADDVFSKLAQKAKVTSTQIINAFLKQIRAQEDYQANFEKLLRRGLPDEFVKQLTDMGLDGASVVAALANANDSAFNRIIAKWRESQRNARDLSSDVTGLGNSIRSLPSSKVIDIIVKQTGGSGAGAGIRQRTGLAQGGVIHGASGFITQGPVFQFGEGGSPTLAGKGAEAVIPLNERGLDILAEAFHRAMGRRGSLGVHVTVGFDESGNLHVRKIAQDEIEREHAFRQRVG